MATLAAWNDQPATAPLHPARPAGTVLDAALADFCGDRTLALSAGAEIFGQGEPANRVYRLLSGVVRTTRLLADGRRQVCDFLHAGDILGPEAGLLHATSAEAVTAVVLQSVDRRLLAARAERDLPLTGELWRLSIDWLARSQDHLMILGRQGAVERVAAFLVGYAERIGADGGFELPMTRQDIGDYLGLTLHTVSRTLCQMQAEGLIDLDHRQVRLRAFDQLLDMVA
ncbi:MAG: transcriptional regulator, Crp/Fnr family [Caulobacter sp.]|jgi:CRP-like cAMP-binding protein|nr:transcriptional regulator, Crp/Fnr family [Caulobacter sp.]